MQPGFLLQLLRVLIVFAIVQELLLLLPILRSCSEGLSSGLLLICSATRPGDIIQLQG
jgi:hypothetical protein